ncbi:MAG: S41 family peptidase [Bacteroidota bacterium]
MEALCRYWGFLKYFHPSIQKGKIDWDKSLIEIIPEINNDSSIAHFNFQLVKIRRFLDPIRKINSSFQYLTKDSSLSILNFKWTSDSSIFSSENIEFMTDVYSNYRPRKNVYVKNEFNYYYGYKGMEKYYSTVPYFPDRNECLLSFFKYWNAVNYFYSYKYYMDQNWNDILIEFLPQILESAGTENFYFTISRLIAKISDCHSYTDNYLINHSIGISKSIVDWTFSPIKVKFIEDSTIITQVALNMSEKSNINIGDIILKINGVAIKVIRDSLRNYYGCSTENSINREIDAGIFTSFFVNTDSIIHLTLLDSLGIKEVSFLNKRLGFSDTKLVSYLVKDSVAYIDLSRITKSEFRKLYRNYSYCKGLIIDLRNGALFPLSASIALRFKKVKKDTRVFALYLRNDWKFPGTFLPDSSKMYYLGLHIFHKSYKGKVILLIDENIQSTFEYELMSLKHMFNVTTLGSNTSGTDGVASSFLIQRNILTYFTTDRVLYPDGTPIQRIGITPDIYCIPTLQSIRNNRDELIFRAAEIIE